MPWPGKHVLIRTLHIEWRSTDRDGQFMTPVEEARLPRCLGNLGDNTPIPLVGIGEPEAALGLDFQKGGTAVPVTGTNDNVVKRMTFWRPLEFDAFNPRAGQPARFCADQQGQQVVGADLPLEMGARWPAGCRTVCGHGHRIPYDVPGVAVVHTVCDRGQLAEAHGERDLDGRQLRGGVPVVTGGAPRQKDTGRGPPSRLRRAGRTRASSAAIAGQT